MHIRATQHPPTATSHMGQVINRQLERAMRSTNIDRHTEIAGVFEAPALCFRRQERHWLHARSRRGCVRTRRDHSGCPLAHATFLPQRSSVEAVRSTEGNQGELTAVPP
jgi:hypothetical protein